MAPLFLPGPTGESNVLHTVPRGRVLCLGPAPADILAQSVLCSTLGNTAIVAELDLDGLSHGDGFDAVAWFGDDNSLRGIRVALSAREGALVPLITSADEGHRLRLERLSASTRRRPVAMPA